MVTVNAVKFHHYFHYFFISIITLFIAAILLPSYSHAFWLGGFESVKGLHLSSADSLLSLGMNHNSGLILGYRFIDPNRFLGVRQIVQISPLLILVAFVLFGIHRTYTAFRPVLAGYGLETSHVVDAAIGLVFIAMGFIVFNIIIEASDAILRFLG